MEIKINLRAFLALCWLLLFLIITILLTPLIRPVAPSEEEISAHEKNSLPFSSTDTSYLQISEGKKLFKSNCATCHNKNMKDPLTGPALGGLTERWADFPTTDLFQWIRNSEVLIQQKHPRAIALWEEWDKKTMNAFPNLTDEDLTALIAYIERE